MNLIRNTRIAATATVVALAAAGGAVAADQHHHGRTPAAVASGSSVHSSTARAFGHRFGDRGPGDAGGPLAVAATYLGMSRDDLLTQLRSGKTLAQIANATSGKSESGLVDALYADAKTHLDAAVAAGRLTQAQEDRILSTLKADITKHVESAGGPGGRGRPQGGDLAVAADYLGLTQSALDAQLQSGKTLAQIANATSGKSADGLVTALLAAEKTEIQAMVNGQMPPRPDGPAFGGPPPGTHP